MTGKADFVGLANYLRIGLSHRVSRGPRPYARLRRSRALILEAVIALPVALALDRGLRGTRVFRADHRAAADGRAGGRRARLALDVRRRLRRDRLARSRFGADGPLWFSDIWLARATIVIANLWLALPFDILMLVAGLASLPREPLEAAEVDGALRRSRLRLVVLPLLEAGDRRSFWSSASPMHSGSSTWSMS